MLASPSADIVRIPVLDKAALQASQARDDIKAMGKRMVEFEGQLKATVSKIDALVVDTAALVARIAELEGKRK